MFAVLCVEHFHFATAFVIQIRTERPYHLPTNAAVEKMEEWVEWIGTKRNEVIKTVYDYFDVEPDVADLVARNKATKKDIEKLRKYGDARKESNQKHLEALEQEAAAMQVKYQQQSQPVLEEYEKTSVAKLMYDEISGGIDSDIRSLQQLQEQEMQGFGFQSKVLFSLALTVEALKTRIASGKPFDKELRALQQEVDNSGDVLLVTEPLKCVADKGLKSSTWLTIAGREAAESLAHAFHNRSSTQVAQSLFSKAKFEMPNAAEIGIPQAKRRDYAVELNDHVASQDYREALKVADEAMERLPQGTRASEDAIVALSKFKEGVVPVLLAHQLFDYCDASLTTTRYSFVENFLDEIGKELGKTHAGEGAPAVEN